MSTVVKPRTKRRRGKSRAKRGLYTSTKTGQTHKYRSSWEMRYMTHLDADATVKTWGYECLEIRYVSAVRSGRLRSYLPDFLVELVDGRKLVVEIKPASKVDKPTNLKKFAAARAWCPANGTEFVVVTEHDMKALGIM